MYSKKQRILNGIEIFSGSAKVENSQHLPKDNQLAAKQPVKSNYGKLDINQVYSTRCTDFKSSLRRCFHQQIDWNIKQIMFPMSFQKCDIYFNYSMKEVLQCWCTNQTVNCSPCSELKLQQHRKRLNITKAFLQGRLVNYLDQATSEGVKIILKIIKKKSRKNLSSLMYAKIIMTSGNNLGFPFHFLSDPKILSKNQIILHWHTMKRSLCH